MRLDICVGGAGGQGVLLFSTVMLRAAVQEGKRALCLPSYGAEARGGEVSCFLILSDRPILSPFAEKVDWLVFFNSASFLKFREHLKPGAGLLYNAAEGPEGGEAGLPEGLQAVGVPLAEITSGLDRRCENLAMLGVFVRLTGILDAGGLEASFRQAYAGRGEGFLGPNLKALAAGGEWARSQAPVPGPAGVGRG